MKFLGNLCVGQFVDQERVHKGMFGRFGRRLVREVKASRRRQLAQKNHNRVSCKVALTSFDVGELTYTQCSCIADNRTVVCFTL